MLKIFGVTVGLLAQHIAMVVTCQVSPTFCSGGLGTAMYIVLHNYA